MSGTGSKPVDQRALAELQRVRDELYAHQLPCWEEKKAAASGTGTTGASTTGAGASTELPQLLTAERLEYLNLDPLAEQLGIPEHLVRQALLQTVRDAQRAAASPDPAW